VKEEAFGWGWWGWSMGKKPPSKVSRTCDKQIFISQSLFKIFIAYFLPNASSSSVPGFLNIFIFFSQGRKNPANSKQLRFHLKNVKDETARRTRGHRPTSFSLRIGLNNNDKVQSKTITIKTTKIP
jgi:hypothetical protein